MFYPQSALLLLTVPGHPIKRRRRVKKVLLVAVFLLTLFSFSFGQSVDVTHFLLYPSVRGDSGYINNPAPYSIRHNMLGLGLHPFVFKFNYGLFDLVEAGINFDFGANKALVDILQNGFFNLKCTPIKEEDFFVTAAAGVRQVPIKIFGETKENDYTLYAVVAKKVEDFNFSLGLKKDLSGKSADGGPVKVFADIGKVVNDTVLLAAEYDGTEINAGVKISLNYNINIDMFITKIGKLGETKELGDMLRNYFVFGITYIQ